jgi:hypothetical protein
VWFSCHFFKLLIFSVVTLRRANVAEKAFYVIFDPFKKKSLKALQHEV